MSSTRQNTPGLGIEYEVHLPAYFALLLNTNPEIEDFQLRSNVEEFGNLDDLLVDIKTRSGENLYFAFQLKHKEKSSKNLLPTNFEARGDFNLEKYCEAFKNLSEESRKKYYFILYTNKNFDSSRTNEVQKFDMKQDECCLGRDFFDTSGGGKHLYKFEVNEETEAGKNVSKDDFREFFSRFSLYTGQTNIRDLDKSHILKILKYGECYVKYVDFFRRWHRGDFTDKVLDKKTLNIHLIDILLSPVAINYHFSDGQDMNLNFFEALVQQFDITIIDASKQDFIKQLEKNVHKYPEEFNKNSKEEVIKLCRKIKLIDRFTKELKEETKLKLLHYFFQKPLILDFHESSQDVIYEASKLCRIQENGIKLVIVGRGINVRKFSHLKIFTNLTRVDEDFLQETKKRCKLSLRNRKISFEEVFEDEIREFVTPRALFQMLKGSFSIGEDKENLPEFYIPRSVSATVFDIESIIKNSYRSEAIVFYYEEQLEELKILIHKIVNCEDYLYDVFLDDNLILRKKELSKEKLHQVNSRDTFPEIMILRSKKCTRKQTEEICKIIGKNDIRLFKVIDEKRCLLLMSTKDTSLKENYESSKISVEEDNIHLFFNNSINILCAQPGMGKSTLMKYLKNVCDPKFWTVRVDLKGHNHFLKRSHNIEDVLNYFLEMESCQDLFLLNIKRMFLRKEQIVFFLDGLDEVENECVDNILNITRQLSEMGFRIWLSSRQNLQQKLEQYFNIFAIEINELNKDQQKNYIENRLASLYNKDEIKEIIDTVFSNTDLVNNCEILEIPLQLHIITKIFLDDKSYYFNLRENSFILTKMFEIFFEGKYKHYLAKFELKHNHFLGTLLEEKLENYELIGLHSVLDDEHLQKLKIENLNVTQIRNSDFLGIITEINNENKAVFEHLTFAEYFASRFLVKNFDKARLLKDEIFAEKYRNLRLIFNIMLAEDSPLHLAIIYKDLGRIEEMGQSSWVDEGGRNFLQVAACVATRHPPLECHIKSSSSECLVKDLPVRYFKGEDLKNKEIVNRLLSTEPFKNDKIFEWNSLDYALATGALYVVESILEKSKTPPNFCKMLGKYYSDEVVAYYSIRFGYHRLLSEILAKKSCHVTRILSAYLWWRANNSILHFLFTLDCTNRNRIVELLTSDDIDTIVYDKDRYTFLHFAVFHADIKVLKFLLEKGADVDVQDIEGKSPLRWAVELNNLEITKLLVEQRAYINITDKDGMSPLFFAVKRENLEILKFLIGKGADVNITDKHGKCPLFWAIKQDNLDISKMLIQNRADVNIKDKDGWSPLFWAIEQNNFEILKLLLEKGAKVNIIGQNRWTPLFWSLKRKNLEISKFLLEKGAYVDITVESGWLPLLWAVEENNFEISKLLIENGARVNIKDKEGWSPLFWAVYRDNLEISKLLLERRANVNIIDNEGRSPLFLAIKQNNIKISKLLIEKGADVNIKDKMNGKSSLFLAFEQNNLEMLKFLVEKGADVNIQDKEYWSLLFWAIKQSNFDISKFLIEKGADVNITDKEGVSLSLFLAVKQGNFEISKLLVENGADVNIKDKDNWSPLLCAIKGNNFDISELLIEKGAFVNIADKEGEKLPLFLAVNRRNFEMSKLLIEKGADVNIRGQKDGRTPLFSTVIGYNFEISKLLVENGADVNAKDKDGRTPLFYALEGYDFEIIKLLVEKGADVNTKRKNGESALFLAISRDDFEMSKLLIEKGADVNIKDKDRKSPLFWAVEGNNLEISKLLLERGAEVNYGAKRNKSFFSSIITSIKLFFSEEENVNVLRLAVQKGYFDFVQFLIEKGAIWDAEIILDAIEGGNIQIIDLFLGKGVDLSKVNALHKAVRCNNIDVVNYLIENGADVNLKNNDGFTILHEASSCGHLKVVEFLLNDPRTAHLLNVPQKKETTTCLHLAVYYGRVEVVELLLKKIKLDKIDIHNFMCPLHFAAVEGRLNKELLIRIAQFVKDRDVPWYDVEDHVKANPHVTYYRNYR